MMASGFLPVLTLAHALERLQVEDGDGVVPAVAGEAAAEVGGDGDAVNALGVGDRALHLAGVGVEDVHLVAVRDVNAAARVVHGEVIPAAVARHRDRLEQAVALRRGDGAGD